MALRHFFRYNLLTRSDLKNFETEKYIIRRKTMPFINSKISVKITPDQEKELKEKLGQAISIIPGKSESWLMTGFEDGYHLYFKGDNSKPMAFVEVMVFGGPNKDAFNKLTAKITEIFGQVLSIAPDNIYVKYTPADDWGWNGSNF